MKEINKGMIMSAILFLMFSSGCDDKSPRAKGQQVLAKINNYELTVRDFQDEARLLQKSRNLAADAARAKAGLLQELIEKQILIQEAQKMNFDKDKAFMKEIERYWEQALLKLLLKKKAGELVGAIEASPAEVREEYKKMKEEDPSIGSLEKLAPEIREELLDKKRTEALEGWIEGLRRKAKVDINKNLLEEITLR